MSFSINWMVLHVFEQVALLDTELVSLRYVSFLCGVVFSSRSPWISSSVLSNQSRYLQDTVPRELIAED